MNRLLCWLIRRFGGTHRYKRVTVLGIGKTRTCQRCGHWLPVKARQKNRELPL
jgi:hypothetical protein